MTLDFGNTAIHIGARTLIDSCVTLGKLIPLLSLLPQVCYSEDYMKYI